MNGMAAIFDFTITLDQYIEHLDVVDAVYARLDDVSLFNADRLTHISFHRAAATLDEAVRSAVIDVHAFGYRVKQITVEPQCVGA
jgi:hypothetical protein